MTLVAMMRPCFVTLAMYGLVVWGQGVPGAPASSCGAAGGGGAAAGCSGGAATAPGVAPQGVALHAPQPPMPNAWAAHPVPAVPVIPNTPLMPPGMPPPQHSLAPLASGFPNHSAALGGGMAGISPAAPSGLFST